MNLRTPGRFLSVAALLVSWSVAGVAHADIPYLDQITPGTLRGVARTGGEDWPLGYWEYLPSDFDDLPDGELLPLLVFLPGIGEYDDVSSCPGNVDVCEPADCGGDGLCRNLTWGPQQLIRLNNWDDTTRPFIMISPQNDVPPFSAIEWDLTELDAFFDFVVANYPIDPRRLYLTGMSQGGRGVFQYVAHSPRRFAAVAPMPGGQVQGGVTCSFQDTALWIFHGEDDNNSNLGAGVFSPCTTVEYASIYTYPDFYPQYPDCVSYTDPRPTGRITMFDDVGHFAWVPAIDPIGQGFPASEWANDQGCGSVGLTFRDYSAANDADGLYTWLLSLDRPDVDAGIDVEMPWDGSPAVLTATTLDDDAITYAWSQTSGPAATLTDADTAAVTIDDLVANTVYTFEVFAVDADNQWDRDEVTLTTLDEVLGGSSSDGGGVGSDSGVGGSTGGGGGSTDGGSSDGGAGSDGGASVGGSSDGGASIGGSSDGGVSVGGSSDGGVSVGGSSDGGVSVGGSSDGGVSVGGSSDSGVSVGATSDGGVTSDGGATSGGGEGTGGSSSDGSASVGITSETGSSSGGRGSDSSSDGSHGSSGAADSGDGSAEGASVGDTSTAGATSAEGGSASASDSDPTATGGASMGNDTTGSTSDAPFAGEDNPGCGCTTEDDRGGATWMFGSIVVGLVRRRRPRR